MRLPNGKLKEIAAVVDLPAADICDYMAGRRRAGSKRAKILEEKLGIPIRTWLFGSGNEITQALLNLKIVVTIDRVKTVELCLEPGFLSN